MSAGDRPAASVRLRRAAPVAVAALILQMVVAMMIAASRDAATYDETAHLTAGILNVREHDLRWNAEHPPLVKLLAGLATAGAHVNIRRDLPAYRAGNEFEMAPALLYGSGNDAEHLLWLGRLPMIGLTALFALVVFGFARDLFGLGGGLVSLALFTLCPTVLANGRLIHTDVPAAGFLLSTAWFLWRARTGGRWWFAAACGAFGLALATKFIALFAIPPLAVLAFWPGFRGAHGSTARRAFAGATRVGVLLLSGLAILWLVYLAASPGLEFHSHFYDVWAGRAGNLTGSVIDHLPVPRAYRVGLRFAVAFDQAGDRRAFLFGRAYRGGSLLFYPAVLLMKTPLGTLALWGAGLAAIVRRRRRLALLAALLLVPVAILAFAMFSRTNIGVRHVAVVPVFGAVIAGAVWVRGATRRRLAAVGILLAATAASVWAAFPSQLSYMNEAFGGHAAAYKRMADSNVDWGQDLKRLASYDRGHPSGRPDWLVYFGTASPGAYGIEASDGLRASRESIHGLVAISVTWLDLSPEKWAWIARGRRPVARVGDTILIYRVP